MTIYTFITRLARRRDQRARDDQGFTLIELLVSMSIFAVLLAVMMSVIVGMTKSMNKTQSIADAAAQGLRATQTLDKELRYADWLNPTPTSPATSISTTSISFEGLTNAGVVQCYQWHLAGGLLQQRSWTSASTTASFPTAASPAWSTVAVGVANSVSVPPFTLTPRPTNAASDVFSQVAVDLVMVGKSQQVGHAETKVVITARNSNYPPGSAQCTNAVTP
jgi:prepilin-type N-terminal cleavage/methylation domain-containing protein